VAIGHTILGIVVAFLASGEPFPDLGTKYFDEREVDHVGRHITRPLERLGYTVALPTGGLNPERRGTIEAGLSSPSRASAEYL
jgi:hypothetical protein